MTKYEIIFTKVDPSIKIDEHNMLNGKHIFADTIEDASSYLKKIIGKIDQCTTVNNHSKKENDYNTVTRNGVLWMSVRENKKLLLDIVVSPIEVIGV